MPVQTAAAQTWFGAVNEDGSFSILARVCALSGSGSEMAVGEGKVIQQADVSAITAPVYLLGTNKNNTSGTVVTPALAPTAAANIFDTLRTVGWPTVDDKHGYNFRLDLGPTYTATGGQWYLVEIKITLTDGTVIQLPVKVKTQLMQTS